MASRTTVALAVATVATISTLSWSLAATPRRLRDDTTVPGDNDALAEGSTSRSGAAEVGVAAGDDGDGDDGERLVISGRLPPLAQGGPGERAAGSWPVPASQAVDNIDIVVADNAPFEPPLVPRSAAFHRAVRLIDRIEQRVTAAIDRVERLRASGEAHRAHEVWQELGAELHDVGAETQAVQAELDETERSELTAAAQTRLVPLLRRLSEVQSTLAIEANPPPDDIEDDPASDDGNDDGIDEQQGGALDQAPTLREPLVEDEGDEGDDDSEGESAGAAGQATIAAPQVIDSEPQLHVE